MMKPYALARSGLARMLAALALAGAQALALAASDPPGRVARINHMEGAVSFLPAGDDEWLDAQRNRPLTRGDQVWTDRGARAELHLGNAALRMNGRTQLQFTELDDNQALLTVPQGQVNLRVRRLHAGEQLAVNTPNLGFTVTQPGEYRLDVDPANGTTRVTLHSGQGTAYGENGKALALAGPQQLTFSGRNLARLGAPAAPRRDDFDQWAAARDRQEERSVSARYVSRDTIGYQQLDPYGDWRMDPAYGPVWSPYVTVAGWAPYRYGHWEYIPPWGWTWIDDAPWGFAPFHYGRWVLISLHWYWVPGPIVVRPVYAPALVAFVGGSAGQVVLSSGQPGVAWFPLAPGEAFRPPYRASPRYLERLNRHQRLPEGEHERLYRFQRQPEAVTAMPREAFVRGRPLRGGEALPLARAELDRARVVATPRFAPERRREEDGMRRAPPDRIPPGWSPRRQELDSRRDMRADERPAPRVGERREEMRRDDERRRTHELAQERARREQALHERAEREQRAMQEQAQRRQHEERWRQQREHEAQQQRQQALRERAERQQHEQQFQRERGVREQAERQQRAMQEQRQRAGRIPPAQGERPQEDKRRLHGERRRHAEAEDERR